MCVQIFAMNFCWSYSFPIKLKSEAYEALSLLFQGGVLPLAIICDYAKEMIIDEFNRKFKEALCQLIQTEPLTPWSTADEREIRELMKGSGRELIKSGSTKTRCDDCLEL